MRALALALLVVSAQAPKGDTPWTIYGPGERSCGAWTNDDRSRDSYWLWVDGYVTGAGAVLALREHIELSPTDGNAIKAWITNYCAAHPLDSIATASVMLLVELNGRALK